MVSGMGCLLRWKGSNRVCGPGTDGRAKAGGRLWVGGSAPRGVQTERLAVDTGQVLLPTSETSQPRPGRTITPLDDAVTRTMGRVTLNAALLLVVVVYVGIGLALPLALGAGVPMLIGCNVVGVSAGWAILFGWLFPTVQATHRRHLLEWTTSLRLLSAQEFEQLIGELLRREGWQVNETGREGAPDGNVDLRILGGDRRMLVQCKLWKSWKVGVDEVRELGGTLLREGLPGDAGMLVTLRGFTEQALAEADKIGIALVDGRELIDRLERAGATALIGPVENVAAGHPCPDCGTQMLLDLSPKGWWLRCPRYRSTGCTGSKDLSRDPRRALELLCDSQVIAS
jgi:Restriction endonuclease